MSSAIYFIIITVRSLITAPRNSVKNCYFFFFFFFLAITPTILAIFFGGKNLGLVGKPVQLCWCSGEILKRKINSGPSNSNLKLGNVLIGCNQYVDTCRLIGHACPSGVHNKIVSAKRPFCIRRSHWNGQNAKGQFGEVGKEWR
jgi:hypothetical protein